MLRGVSRDLSAEIVTRIVTRPANVLILICAKTIVSALVLQCTLIQSGEVGTAPSQKRSRCSNRYSNRAVAISYTVITQNENLTENLHVVIGHMNIPVLQMCNSMTIHFRLVLELYEYTARH